LRPQPGRASLGRRSLEAERADTRDGGPRGDEPERSDDARPRRRLHKRGEEATAPGPLPVWASRASGLRFFSYSTACYVSNLEFLVIRARSVAFLSSDCVERSDQRREVVTFRGRRRADRTRSGPCRVRIESAGPSPAASRSATNSGFAVQAMALFLRAGDRTPARASPRPRREREHEPVCVDLRSVVDAQEDA
jgi:hypothetical protein